MSRIISIDPGPENSAIVVMDGPKIEFAAKMGNCGLIVNTLPGYLKNNPEVLIEMVAGMGMPVGKEVFETVFWIGRFCENVGNYRTHRIYRRDIKLHFCNSMKAKDSNIRAAIIDRYGGKENAIGKKASPGPLYSIKADCWSALALALFWQDCHEGRDQCQK